MDKQSLRAFAINKRKELKDISESLVLDLINSHILENKQKIGIYYPLKYEINVLPLIEYYKDKEFYFPKTIGNDIAFYSYNNDFIKGPFNIMEPNNSEVIDRDLIDAFIIPCVLITKNKQRIGYGKGYYDRYLSGYKGLKIALIYKELSNIDFIADDYDIKLDYIFEE
ncbi:MAG: 5-formyltetrahydrofolate cyclo-ligase [Anaeroplasmataceae bacterium]